MPVFRTSTLWLTAICCILLAVLIVFQDALLEAHINETIQYVASDASTYYKLYEAIDPETNLVEAPSLLLVGSPILFMKLTNGNLLLIQLLQLALMISSLKVGMDCFRTLRGRIAFILGALMFPYFLFGFLSLNKEIYAMCAAIFFASYMVRGKMRHLLGALMLAIACRYYMLIALVVLLYLVPRMGRLHYWRIAILLAVISISAPVIKWFVPAYSAENLLEDSGAMGWFFATGVDYFCYALIYPFKYLVLILMRAYGFMIDQARITNAMEGVVSLVSLTVFALSSYIVLLRQSTSDLVRRFILIAVVAPIPIMWSEIMHWRYYSFVYFFFLFALVLHYTERPCNEESKVSYE